MVRTMASVWISIPVPDPGQDPPAWRPALYLGPKGSTTRLYWKVRFLDSLRSACHVKISEVLGRAAAGGRHGDSAAHDRSAGCSRPGTSAGTHWRHRALEIARRRNSFTSRSWKLRQVSALDPALGLRGVRADDIHVECGQGARPNCVMPAPWPPPTLRRERCWPCRCRTRRAYRGARDTSASTATWIPRPRCEAPAVDSWRRPRRRAMCTSGRGPRTFACSQASIWTSSLRQTRRVAGAAVDEAGAAAGRGIGPASIIHRRSVSRERATPCCSVSFSHASVGPKSA